MLAHMFKDKDAWGNKQDHRGAFLIDRSPEYFEPILNYLRHGQLIVNDGINLLGVLEEARFFGIDSLIEHLEIAIKLVNNSFNRTHSQQRTTLLYLEKSLCDSCWQPQPSLSCDVRVSISVEQIFHD